MPHGEERRAAARLEPWPQALAAILREASLRDASPLECSHVALRNFKNLAPVEVAARGPSTADSLPIETLEVGQKKPGTLQLLAILFDLLSPEIETIQPRFL